MTSARNAVANLKRMARPSFVTRSTRSAAGMLRRSQFSTSTALLSESSGSSGHSDLSISGSRSNSSLSSLSSSTSHSIDNVAFAFDIDGVLIRGARALDRAKPALELLNHRRVPWVLLTNGGGKSEQERVADLSRELGIHIDEKQFIQSHTPFKALTKKYKRVLVIGGDGDNCRKVAEQYGFQDVVICADVVASDPKVWPFHRYQLDEIQSWVRPDRVASVVGNVDPFDAIMVFNDPRDMGSAVQITMDLLVSNGGLLGTRDPSLKQAIPIYFSNNDLLWANDYPVPRFGQGAFRVMVEALFKELTGGRELQSTIMGKPTAYAYDYCKVVLGNWCRENFPEKTSLSSVFMVGDNPASDIQGANDYGWRSILVRTGVFQDSDFAKLKAEAVPESIVDDVYDAVEYGLTVGPRKVE